MFPKLKIKNKLVISNAAATASFIMYKIMVVCFLLEFFIVDFL